MRLLAMGWIALGAAAAAIDPSREILARWPGSAPEHVELLREAGVTVVVLPRQEKPDTERFAAACAAAGIRSVVEVDAPAEQSSLPALLAGLKGLDALVLLGPQQIHWQVEPAHAVLRAGLWPGIRSGPNVPGRGIEVATASREPWVDSNPYLVAYLRGKYPQRAALLGYRPDAGAGVARGRAVPYETLELALVEAFAAGGNFVLSVDDAYYQALLTGDARARAAWRSLGQTARFLLQNREWFRRPSRTRVAIASGTLAESGELVNLMYRRNLSPAVVPAETIPALDPVRFRALVAANLPTPSSANLERIRAFARAGGIVIAAGKQPWWVTPEATKSRADADRDFYTLGKGQIIAYRAPIADPSEFALDVIDALGVRTRDLRLWNAPTVIGLAAADGPRALLHLINYGDPLDTEFPARIEGVFAKATLHEPGAPPRSLKAAKRGSATEVTVDRLGRLGVIVLE